jgi:uncharacterized protein
MNGIVCFTLRIFYLQGARMILKIIKYLSMVTMVLLTLATALIFIIPMTFDPGKLPLHYASVNSKLFVGEGEKQPLLVYFGGSEGGNNMTKSHNIEERQLYNDQGYAMLAIGYFGMEGIPKELDRISLDAIHQEIMLTLENSVIDASCVAVMGGSKGAELALTLASKYPDIKGVVSFAGSHVVFAGPSFYSDAETSSFMFNDKQLTNVPLGINILPAILLGDFRRAHEIALEDLDAVENARIEVENIQGPILLISGEKDHVWPSKEMSDEVMNRLKNKNFAYPFQHIVVPNGDHFQPQNDYHPQAIAFLNTHFLPRCDS